MENLDWTPESIRFWAHEMLGDLDASRFPQFYELKRHVYALGKLAGLTVQQCRTLSSNLWLTSP
eukprot:2745859-Karenia_brevis.AAC.1